MQPRPSRWACAPYDVGAALRLCAELGVSQTVGAVLVRRGLGEPERARRFLAADERHDPALLPGVPEACEAILRHVADGARIAVHGDYDVDGVCSTAIVVRTLRALGADPLWELPSRFGDGYGLSVAAVERLAARGVGLLITVDCGITAVAEVAAARAAGLEVVVTDHHRPGERLPDCTVVHPALDPGPDGYPCPELCAAGVALKLSEALYAAAGRDPGEAAEELELAALATVCDLVPLRGENRRIVREGLVALGRTRRPGLRALMAVSALEPGEVSEQAVGFRLGPRLNAAGRMNRADAALELLLTEDERRAQEVARELDLLNGDRREAETRILFAAEAACAEQASAGALVVAGEGWHPGVVGIVASRLVERWRRPCVVIALDGDAGRGSGRSISPYDLHAGLAACAPHLRRFGGHRMAAGVELDAAAVEPFRRALAAHAGAALAPGDLIAEERVDAVVPGGALGLDLAEELERLRPFGMGNPQPTLLVPAARIEGVAGMGEERQHARFTLVTGGSRSRGVAFGSPPRSLSATSGTPHDLAVRLERNRWNGAVEPRVILRACCPTRAGTLRVLGEDEPFWTRLERELERERAGERTGPGPEPFGTRLERQPERERAGERAGPGPEPFGTRLERQPERELAGPGPAGVVLDRRGGGFAGVVGDLLTSGETVLVAVADVARRRASLQAVVAGLARGPLAVASWTAIGADPALAGDHAHLVALDPPPGGTDDPLLGAIPTAHLAWGPAEVEFALALWRAELDLRPALADAWRALRAVDGDVDAAALERALRGTAGFGRSPECCARILLVLSELGLIERSAADRSCRLPASERKQLEASACYRACRARLAEIERALALPARAPTPARAA